MEIIDISRGLTEAAIYPGTKNAEVTREGTIENCGWNLTEIKSSVHVSTHADAFCHALESETTIEEMNLDYFIGPCHVIKFPKRITCEILKDKLPEKCERLVVKGDGKAAFDEYCAEYLRKRGIKTVVTDNMTIGVVKMDSKIHRSFFKNKIAVVENVVLEGVEEGEYFLFAPPIKITGSDGGFVRAILLKNFK